MSDECVVHVEVEVLGVGDASYRIFDGDGWLEWSGRNVWAG